MREEPMEPEEQEKTELLSDVTNIVGQVADEKTKAAQRWSVHTSIALRLAGLILSMLLAIIFDIRHRQDDLDRLAGTIPSQLDWLIIVVGLVLLPIFVFIDVRRIIGLIKADRSLTPSAILSNWFYVMCRPMLTYLFWSAIFYTWPNVNVYGFRYVVIGFIIGSNLRMRFRECRPELRGWRDEPTGR